MPETSNSELPELPEWVQDLIASAEQRGYWKGWEEGGKETRQRLRVDLSQLVKSVERTRDSLD